MNLGQREFNTTLLGHKRVSIICPACRRPLSMEPAKFHARKKRSNGALICCSEQCRWGLERATKIAAAEGQA